MKTVAPFLVSALLCVACGGGGGGSASSNTGPDANFIPPDILAGSQTAATLPNEHGVYADANNVFPSDEDAGIFRNENGIARSFSTAGKIDANGPFFKPFGNGRSCASCHKQEDGFSITTRTLNKLFDSSGGSDPVFRSVDAANSPLAPVGTPEERRAAYSLLLNRGVFRIARKIPESAEFELVKADDPYHYAHAGELSLYRRPLPSANLKFLSDVMWDERETAITQTSFKTCNSQSVCFEPVDADLGRQATNATLMHAEAQSGLSSSDQDAIVAFEKTLFVAQQVDNQAGLLFAANGSGGALSLSTTRYSFALNDIFSGDFLPLTFTLFRTWIKDASASDPKAVEAREAITRGQNVFNSKNLFTSNLPGMERRFTGTFFVNCSTCHSTPNVGTLSEPLGFNIGVANAANRKPDMPLYTLRNKKTGELVETQDPGIAMTTGLWRDIGRFKVPGLRGLSTRAPYFHDGSAKTIEDVTAFYNKLFDNQMSDQEIKDLNAFLKAL